MDWALPPDVTAERFSGLLHVQLVRGANAHVLAFWQGQESYISKKEEFFKVLQVDKSEYEGRVAHCRSVKGRLSVREVVLALGTLVGAFLAINDFGAKVYSAFFASPDAVVAVDSVVPINVLENTPVEIRTTVQNHGSASLDAECEQCRLEPLDEKLDKMNLQVAAGEIPRLTAGQTYDLKLTAVGRAADRHNPAPDRYALRGSLKVTSGWWAGTGHPVLPDREVEIWPTLAWSPPRVKQIVNGPHHYAVFETHIFTGVPRELPIATFELQDAEDVKVLNVAGYQSKPDESADHYDRQISWNPGKLQQFGDVIFEITLESPRPMTEAAWKAYESRVSMAVQ
jgi:hypothetical protein